MGRTSPRRGPIRISFSMPKEILAGWLENFASHHEVMIFPATDRCQETKIPTARLEAGFMTVKINDLLGAKKGFKRLTRT
jgi:hypothetical protein